MYTYDNITLHEYKLCCMCQNITNNSITRNCRKLYVILI